MITALSHPAPLAALAALLLAGCAGAPVAPTPAVKAGGPASAVTRSGPAGP